MFCRLYEFSIDTGLALTTPSARHDCPYHTDDSCSNCSKVEERLEKDHWGWVIDRRVLFPGDMTCSGSYKHFNAAIRMIHPVKDNIWVVQLFNDKQEFTYKIFSSSNSEFKTIDELNDFVRGIDEYVGRILKEKDFII